MCAFGDIISDMWNQSTSKPFFFAQLLLVTEKEEDFEICEAFVVENASKILHVR